MTEKVKVILRDGSEVSLFEWQKLYGLKQYSNQIGKYYSLNEDRFKKDLALFGELVVNELLIRVIDLYREKVNQSVTINSFNRNKEYQKKLTDKGYRTAEFSPHMVKLAADADTPGVDDLRKLRPGVDDDKLWELAVKINRDHAAIMKACGDELGIKVRVGNEQYLKEKKQTFIHVDVCPEYFAKGKPWHNQFHPVQWEKSITW